MSAQERPKLLLLDGQGEVDELHDQTAIPSDVALLVEEIVDLRRKLSAARAQITKLTKVDPMAETISSVLEHWHAVCRHSDKRVKIPLDGKRAECVKAGLMNEYTPEQLKRVVSIAAELPFEQFGQRFPEPAPGRVKRDDLTYLMANEARVEAILASYEVPIAYRAYRHFVHDLTKRHPAVMAVLAMLAGEEPHGEVLARAARWAKREEDKRKGDG